MPKAIWNHITIAESDETVVVEGNHYFPREAVNWDYLSPRARHTICPWKGTASYYDIHVNGASNRDAAWTYPQPSNAARRIRDYVAFWKGVKVQ
jgi:uncharacterized protein (DUF427 family)